MTADVITLGSRRRRPVPDAGCACTPDRRCYPHRCEVIALQLSRLLASTEGELLVDREAMADPVVAALAQLDDIVTECFRPSDAPPTRTGGER